MSVPSALLLCYFKLANQNLQSLIDDSPSQDDIPPPSEIKLDWHRGPIIVAQMNSLDEALLEWNDVTRDDVQAVLRQIGEGDFSRVVFDDATNYQNLTAVMEQTNDLARCAFSNSILLVEWQFGYQNVQSRVLKGSDDVLSNSSILEYCALVTSAVRLLSVQNFLENGGSLFPRKDCTINNVTSSNLDTVESRLEHIQKSIWYGLGWDPKFASSHLQQFLASSNPDDSVAEALTKYTSTMTVIINNLAELPQSDDGTTRIINVSYSEKVVTVPQDMNGEGTTIASMSAPSSHSMHEHSTAQQRQQLDIAQKTSMLQQQIWDEFESLSRSEQDVTLRRAEHVQREFLEKVMSTPPGQERVLLMQNMSEDDQKLLVLDKLWKAHNAQR